MSRRSTDGSEGSGLMAHQICLGSLAKVVRRVEYILLQKEVFSNRWMRTRRSIRTR